MRRLLDLDDDTAVVIRQFAGRDPGCSSVQTVVGVLPMGGAARRWTLRGSVEQLTEDDLRTLLTSVPDGARRT